LTRSGREPASQIAVVSHYRNAGLSRYDTASQEEALNETTQVSRWPGWSSGGVATRGTCTKKAMPVIGFLHAGSLDAYTKRLAAFHYGLKEAGYSEGENVTIEYRWAGNQIDRLPIVAAELARRHFDVIVASPSPVTVLAAKAATNTIPIVFLVSDDPVKIGLVLSLARPGGNLTGVSYFNLELVPKRLEVLHSLLPAATRIAVLVDPANARNAASTSQATETAGRAIGLQIEIIHASTSREIDAAFAAMARARPDVYSLAAIRCSTHGVSNWRCWRRAMQSRRPIRRGSTQNLAD
jgi:ABC-type uncharacterized transport system substrate-binding protein